ncbi:MAG: amidase [Rhodospirillales bacterium]
MDIAFKSAGQLAKMIKRGKITSLDLLDHYLERVERLNPKINAIIWMDKDGARKRAKAADRALKKGDLWGPLHGVPMTIKESYDVKGSPTTWGDPSLKNNIATKNSLAVDRLLQAGVVLFGKTNVPLMLADWQSYNDIYGTANNPWDVTRSPGGSSGGSAAALAAGLTGIDAGSDIGASIRNPAHYCGVFGHKPTWNILSPRGHALPGKVAHTDISVIGPLARSAADLELAMDAMLGLDAVDKVGLTVSLPKPRKKNWREFKIGLMLTDKNSEVDRQVQDRLQALADFLGKKKVKLVAGAKPDIDTSEAMDVYIGLLRAATSGRQSDQLYAKNKELAAGLKPNDNSYYAQMTRANVLGHRDWLALNEKRMQMRLKWAAFFDEYDLLLCPAAASAAFPHDQKGERYQRKVEVNGHPVPTTDQLFWAGYMGVSFLPSTVAPIGFTREGLPVGVQIVAGHYRDRESIAFASMLEREYQGFVPPPGF